MSKKFLAVLIFLSAVVLTPFASSQPELPHRVYGEITDSSNNSPVQGLDVTFQASDVLGQDSTDSEGFYDVKISGAETGEEVYMFVEGENTSEYVVFERGSSEELDYSGNFSSGQNDETNDGTENNTEEEENTGNQGSGNEEDSSSSSGGGGGGGGYLPPQEDKNDTEEENDSSGGLAPPNTKRIQVKLDGSTTVDVGPLVENQKLVVEVTGGSDSLTGLSLVSRETVEDVSLELSTSDKPLAGRSLDNGRAYSYIVTGISGLSDYSDAELGFKVDKSWLDSKEEMNTGDVFLKGQASSSWRTIGSSFLAEEINTYRYSAEFRPGSFVVGVPEKPPERADLQITEFNVVQIENTSKVRVEASITNNGNIAGEKTFQLMKGSESVEDFNFSLQAGESKSITYETEASPGTTSFSMGGQQKQVEIADNSSDLLLYIVLSVLGLIAVLVAVIVVRERRQAREMEQQIKRINQREQNVEGRMQNLRQNVSDLQRNLRDDENSR